MKIVFVTRMGNTDELVRQKLGYTDAIQIVDGSEKVDGDYVLFRLAYRVLWRLVLWLVMRIHSLWLGIRL